MIDGEENGKVLIVGSLVPKSGIRTITARGLTNIKYTRCMRRRLKNMICRRGAYHKYLDSLDNNNSDRVITMLINMVCARRGLGLEGAYHRYLDSPDNNNSDRGGSHICFFVPTG